MSNLAPARTPGGKERGFALACGLWIGITLLKFGNPVIFGDMITAPESVAEFVFTPWPVAWGYLILAIVALSVVPILVEAMRARRSRPA